jgi:hypothetical protein
MRGFDNVGVEPVARREPASSLTMDSSAEEFVRPKSFSDRFSSTKEMPAPGIPIARHFLAMDWAALGSASVR